MKEMRTAMLMANDLFMSNIITWNFIQWAAIGFLTNMGASTISLLLFRI